MLLKQPFNVTLTGQVCPVQVSAGNQLFHVVVDDDDVATRITALLTAEKAGRVTFIPLNRINPGPVQYPDFGDDALPLVDKINCAERHKKAVAQASTSHVPPAVCIPITCQHCALLPLSRPFEASFGLFRCKLTPHAQLSPFRSSLF